MLFCTGKKPSAWTDLHVVTHFSSINEVWSHLAISVTELLFEVTASLQISVACTDRRRVQQILNLANTHKDMSIFNIIVNQVPTRFIWQCTIGLRWTWYLTLTHTLNSCGEWDLVILFLRLTIGRRDPADQQRSLKWLRLDHLAWQTKCLH